MKKWFVACALLLSISLLAGGVSAQGSRPPKPTPRPSAGPITPGPKSTNGHAHPRLAPAQPAPAAVGPQNSGGPDAFGYIWDDSGAANWISGDTTLDLTGDDNYAPIDIGFNFPFYDNRYSQLFVSTNGLITFEQGSTSYFDNFPPDRSLPNNLIAPFWTDLTVGDSFNSGEVLYRLDGTAPSRSLIIEWRNVTRYNASDQLTFEAILYENGDILVQYHSMSGDLVDETVGIENGDGTDGLNYPASVGGVSDNLAILFHRVPSAHVNVTPGRQSQFAKPNDTRSFPVTIRNSGDLGTDRFELTATSPWPVTFYAANGSQPLADTDADGTPDTGPLATFNTTTVIAKVKVPAGAQVGSASNSNVTVTSSISPSRKQTVVLQTAIPAPFVQIYEDSSDGAVGLDLFHPTLQRPQKITPSNYIDSYDLAVAEIRGDKQFVAGWDKGRCTDTACNGYVYEIEYTIMNQFGDLTKPVSRLTNAPGPFVYDSFPAFAVTPNKRIGVIWQRSTYDPNSDTYSGFNIFFAVLNASGGLIYGPANVTNNAVPGDRYGLNVPAFYHPRITATDDNRFVLAWRRQVWTATTGTCTDAACSIDDIYSTVRASTSPGPTPIRRLTFDTPGPDEGYDEPSLTSIAGGRFLVAYDQQSDSDIYYQALTSGGASIQPATNLTEDGSATTDYAAVGAQLSDGNIIIAWSGYGNPPRINYTVLDNTFTRVSSTRILNNPASQGDDWPSITADAQGHAIVSWTDSGYPQHSLYYALLASGGTVTPPVLLRSTQYSDARIVSSFAGYGISTVSFTPLPTRPIYVPFARRPAAQPPCDPYETPGVKAVGPIVSGQTYQGKFCSGDPDDLYFFNAGSAGRVTFSITLPATLNNELQVNLYDSTKLICGSEGPVASGFSKTCDIAGSGTYKLLLTTTGKADNTNPYSLSVTYP